MRALALTLCLALAACGTTRIVAADRNATILVNGRVEGRGVAEITRRGVPSSMIIEVRNFERHSELEILAFPLDDKQRPLLEQRDHGRFIAIVPGYVEAGDWPMGRYLGLIGRITGDRRGAIREAEYVYPEVAVDRMHLWPRDFRKPGPRISVGIGVGVGF